MLFEYYRNERVFEYYTIRFSPSSKYMYIVHCSFGVKI